MLIYKTLLALAITLLFANDPKHFELKKGSLQMSKTVKEIIKKTHPDMKIMNQKAFTSKAIRNASGHPMAIIGDFNGDKKSDLSFYGYSEKTRKFYIYALLSGASNDAFEMVQVESYPFGTDQKFTGFETYLTLGDKRAIKASRDTIQIETDSNSLMTVEPYYYSLTKKDFKLFRGQMD